MHPIAKNYPFIHKSWTLCVLHGEFLQWTHRCDGFVNTVVMLGVVNIFSFRCPRITDLWPASGGIGGTRPCLISTPSVWERVVVLGHDIAVGGF